jgi:hypothetical protein
MIVAASGSSIRAAIICSQRMGVVDIADTIVVVRPMISGFNMIGFHRRAIKYRTVGNGDTTTPSSVIHISKPAQ